MQKTLSLHYSEEGFFLADPELLDCSSYKYMEDQSSLLTLIQNIYMDVKNGVRPFEIEVAAMADRPVQGFSFEGLGDRLAKFYRGW
jgi:hypothetical protein